MAGDNDKVDKIRRAYRKLLEAILTEEPLEIVIGMQERYEKLTGTKLDLYRVLKDSEKWGTHVQGGHLVLLPKTSMMYMKIESEVRKLGAHQKEKMDFINRASAYPEYITDYLDEKAKNQPKKSIKDLVDGAKLD